MMQKVSSRLILAARISELLEFSWGWISPTAQGQQFLIIPEQRDRQTDRQTETERDRCSKLEIELTLPKQLIPRSSSRDTTTNTVATVATAHAGVCSSDFCCSAIFWSTGPKTNSLHLHTHLQLNPKIFYGKKKEKRKKSSQSQDQAALQQHELYKTCAFAASEIKMHRFQRQLHQFSQNLLPINYCSRYLELNSAAAAAASYCVPALFEIRGKSRGTSASTNSAKLRSWYYWSGLMF